MIKAIRFSIMIALTLIIHACGSLNPKAIGKSSIHNPIKNTYSDAFYAMTRASILYENELYDVLRKELKGDSLIIQMQNSQFKVVTIKGKVAGKSFIGAVTNDKVRFNFSGEGGSNLQDSGFTIIPGEIISAKDLEFRLKMSGAKHTFDELYNTESEYFESCDKVVWYSYNYGNRIRIAYVDNKPRRSFKTISLSVSTLGCWEGNLENRYD